MPYVYISLISYVLVISYFSIVYSEMNCEVISATSIEANSQWEQVTRKNVPHAHRRGRPPLRHDRLDCRIWNLIFSRLFNSSKFDTTTTITNTSDLISALPHTGLGTSDFSSNCEVFFSHSNSTLLLLPRLYPSGYTDRTQTAWKKSYMA